MPSYIVIVSKHNSPAAIADSGYRSAQGLGSSFLSHVTTDIGARSLAQYIRAVLQLHG